MALPQIKHKLYEHYLVGAKEKVLYRPFTVAEQKILVQAKEESTDVDTDTAKQIILLAVSQMITNCTMGKLDAEKLASFDVEDLFIRLRAKSVGERFNVRYAEHYEDEDGKPQTNFIDVNINLNDVKVSTPEGHNNIIQITDEIGIVMRYPTLKIMGESADSSELAIACIESIFDGEEMYETSITPKQELLDFYESIESSKLADIKKFFDTLPKLRHEVEIELHDGKKETLKFEGLESFFT